MFVPNGVSEQDSRFKVSGFIVVVHACAKSDGLHLGTNQPKKKKKKKKEEVTSYPFLKMKKVNFRLNEFEDVGKHGNS